MANGTEPAWWNGHLSGHNGQWNWTSLMEWTFNLLPWDASTVKITKWKRGQQGSTVNKHGQHLEMEVHSTLQENMRQRWDKHNEHKFMSDAWVKSLARTNWKEIQRQYYKKRTHIQETFDTGRTFEAKRTISMDLWRKQWSHELILQLVNTWWWRSIIKMHTKTWTTDTRT